MSSQGRLVVLFCWLLLFVGTALSQVVVSSGKVQIKGTVSDSTRARIPGAHVVAVPAGASSGPSVTSDANGEFSLAVEPGDYTLRVSHKGFVSSSHKIRLHRVDAEPIEFVLKVAPASDVVTIVEDAPYLAAATTTATRTPTPLIDVPQSVTVVTRELMADQMLTTIGDVVRYVPGITHHQGENNRDQLVIRGNTTTADFFLNGVRDDMEYMRDLYNIDRVEALKGPNAMIFGRGGAGGVINRVTKEADFTPVHEFTLQGGSFNDRRFSADYDTSLGKKLALRFNGVYEASDSFRDFVEFDRYGINPTLTFAPGTRTKVIFGYERFHDGHVADRGLPSFQGRPVDLPISTYIGDPHDSRVRADVNLGTATVEHTTHRGLTIRNRSLFAGYDRFYLNYVPGAVSGDKELISVSAYNNASNRLNMFNQTDVSHVVLTGRLRHTLLGGVELGRQRTDNFRNTGYFNDTSTSILVPYNDTVIDTPATFRQSATDADNNVRTRIGAIYLQDQVQVSRYVQLLGGVRFDYFDLQYHNNRNGDDLRRIDRLVSPRAGVVIKPRDRLSVYGSYSVSYLPSSGDQFSSLTNITQQVKPEKFANYEMGIKWDMVRSLSLTTAVYQLNRTNTRSIDPNDPTRIVQTGSSRTNGFEVGVNGNLTRAWQIAGGYAYQDAYVTSASSAARAGAQLAQVPHHTFSLWNRYQFLPSLGAGLGITNRSDMFAAIDNTVILPGYTRADAAVFYSVTERMRLQVNVDNLLNNKYYLNANNNNNISPGSSRAVRAGLIARF
ncbi:MAG TPA: TonB-dependent siderophore receptor [Terriglobales bacterium]|nr:TonB-dependent siderophore receptor [Terriglobales bacterium]